MLLLGSELDGSSAEASDESLLEAAGWAFLAAAAALLLLSLSEEPVSLDASELSPFSSAPEAAAAPAATWTTDMGNVGVSELHQHHYYSSLPFWPCAVRHLPVREDQLWRLVSYLPPCYAATATDELIHELLQFLLRSRYENVTDIRSNQVFPNAPAQDPLHLGTAKGNLPARVDDNHQIGQQAENERLAPQPRV